MRRLFTVTLLGVAAACVILALPAQSTAGDYHRSGYHQSRYYDDCDHHGSYYRSPRPRVVYHADSYHWTPRRGLHSHGHYHVVPRRDDRYYIQPYPYPIRQPRYHCDD